MGPAASRGHSSPRHYGVEGVGSGSGRPGDALGGRLCGRARSFPPLLLLLSPLLHRSVRAACPPLRPRTSCSPPPVLSISRILPPRFYVARGSHPQRRREGDYKIWTIMSHPVSIMLQYFSSYVWASSPLSKNESFRILRWETVFTVCVIKDLLICYHQPLNH